MYKKFVSISKDSARASSKSPLHVRMTTNENNSLIQFNSTPVPSCKSDLQSLKKKTLIYEKEEKVLRSRITFVNVDYEIELFNQNKDLQLKVDSLVKENKKLAMSQSSSPQLKPLETEEDLFRKIQIMKNNIKNIEKTLEDNQIKFKSMSIKVKDLEKLYETLSTNLPSSRPLDRNLPARSDLSKRLKTLENLSKSTKLKLESRIKERENELKSLQDEEVQLQSKLFKQAQQKRLLLISQNDYSLRKTLNIRHNSPDIRHPDINFLYKPSIRALYNT